MTLNEALETNCPYMREGMSGWYPANTKMLSLSRESILATDWIVQRKPIIFECEWSLTDDGRAVPVVFDQGKLNPFIGKRTRVTVEVLDD